MSSFPNKEQEPIIHFLFHPLLDSVTASVTLKHSYPHFFAHLDLLRNPHKGTHLEQRLQILLPFVPAPSMPVKLLFSWSHVTLILCTKVSPFEMSDMRGFDLKLSLRNDFKFSKCLEFQIHHFLVISISLKETFGRCLLICLLTQSNLSIFW